MTADHGVSEVRGGPKSLLNRLSMRVGLASFSKHNLGGWGLLRSSGYPKLVETVRRKHGGNVMASMTLGQLRKQPGHAHGARRAVTATRPKSRYFRYSIETKVRCLASP